MPKSKPKKKKETSEAKDPTSNSTPGMDSVIEPSDTSVPDTSVPTPSPEPEVNELDAPRFRQGETIDRDLLKLRFCLRTGIEHWKAEIVGKPLMKHIARAYLAYKLGIPITTARLFKQIEDMDIDVIHDIEAFESMLCSAGDSWLANKKK